MAAFGCLTCNKANEAEDGSLRINDNEDIKTALSKHFWFTEDQYIYCTLCQSCWRQIKDFHRFYCEVEALHSNQLFFPIPPLEIKEEPEEVTVDQPTIVDNVEKDDLPPTKLEYSSDDDDDDEEEKDRKPLSKIAKRTRVQKRELDEVQQYVSKHIKLECDTCSRVCKTFDDLQRHSMMEHEKRANVICCDLKLTLAYRFVDHIRYHLNPNKFKCPQCSKRCGNRETLSRHIRSAHSPGPEEVTKKEHGEEVDRKLSDLTEKINQKKESEELGTSEDKYDVAADGPFSGGVQDVDDYEDFKPQDHENGSSSSGNNTDSEDVDDDEDDDENTDNEDDSNYQEEEFQLGKRTRLTKAELAEIQDYVSKNMTLECDTCSERCPTYEDLQNHSMKEHEKRAMVRCCDFKLANSYRFVDHIRFHLNPDRFKCLQCEKKCFNRDALRRHVQKFHTPENEKKYHCEVCFSKFSTRKALTRHRNVHEEFDPKKGDGTRKRKYVERAKRDVENEKMIAEFINLECDTCTKKFDTFLILQKHSMLEHKKLSYVFCCGQRFNKKPRLVDHVHFHLNPSKFQCKICQKKLPHTESLRRHMDRNHSQEAKTFKCSMCPKMFTHKKFLSIHERWHNRRWQCEICDRRFICEAILKQHHKSVHTKELNYVCHVCAKTFHIYSTYRSHLESHDGTIKKKPQKPPVQCQICNAWTPKLSHHMRLHSGTRTCELCGQECKNVVAYRYHMKHHETGDHMCSVCGKGFKKELSLKEHMASHTGVTLYTCDFCDRTFNSNANRAAHRKKMHPQQWMEDKLKKKMARYGGNLPPEAMTV